MELQLGTLHPTKGFDQIINNLSFEPREKSGLESWKGGDDNCFDIKTNVNNKRSFDEAFDKIRDDQSQMMPLLLWSGQPNEEDDQAGQKKRNSSIANKNEEEEKHVVGWPPIQSWRKKLLHHQGHVGRIQNNNRMDEKEL